jgi:hypothetical protein
MHLFFIELVEHTRIGFGIELGNWVVAYASYRLMKWLFDTVPHLELKFSEKK